MSNESWSDVTDEDLAGHFLLAGIDQRFADQRQLAAECEARGMLHPGEQVEIERKLTSLAKTTGLPGPIVAGPGD